MRWFYPLIILIFAAGCASRAGVEEFRAYVDSFEQISKASEPILNDLRGAERRFYVGRIKDSREVGGEKDPNAKDNGYVEIFHPEHAIYFAEAGDPPLTAAFRGSLATVLSYNRTLMLYADGDALGSLMSEVDRLSNETTGVLTAFGIADPDQIGEGVSGLDATVNLAAANLPGLTPVLVGLRQAAAAAVEKGSREAFRVELLARHGDVEKLIDVLIDGSEVMFEILTVDIRTKLRRASGARRDELLAALEVRRGMLAEWVVALRAARVALASAVAAAQAPGTPTTFVRSAADATSQIRISAERIRTLSAVPSP